MRRVVRRSVGVTAVLLALGGCLGPRADPSAFFLLSPEPGEAAGPVPVTLGIGPLTLAGYLDRPQIVVRLSDNEVALSEADRWAEPLAESVVRTIEANLRAMLPGATFVAYPWFAAEAPAYGVALELRRFDADTSGQVVLDAAWQITAASSVVERGDARLEDAAEAPGTAPAVAAQSRALGQLSRQIAAAIRRAETGR